MRERDQRRRCTSTRRASATPAASPSARRQIDWEDRERELRARARPASPQRRRLRLPGARQRRQGQRLSPAHVLKYKYGMHPLTVHLAADPLHRYRLAEFPQLDRDRRLRQHHVQAERPRAAPADAAGDREPAASVPDVHPGPEEPRRRRWRCSTASRWSSTARTRPNTAIRSPTTPSRCATSRTTRCSNFDDLYLAGVSVPELDRDARPAPQRAARRISRPIRASSNARRSRCTISATT